MRLRHTGTQLKWLTRIRLHDFCRSAGKLGDAPRIDSRSIRACYRVLRSWLVSDDLLRILRITNPSDEFCCSAGVLTGDFGAGVGPFWDRDLGLRKTWFQGVPISSQNLPILKRQGDCRTSM